MDSFIVRVSPNTSIAIELTQRADGHVMMLAHWVDTRCALTPHVSIERWQDGQWRVAGTQTGFSSAKLAATDIVSRIARADDGLPYWAKRFA